MEEIMTSKVDNSFFEPNLPVENKEVKKKSRSEVIGKNILKSTTPPEVAKKSVEAGRPDAHVLQIFSFDRVQAEQYLKDKPGCFLFRHKDANTIVLSQYKNQQMTHTIFTRDEKNKGVYTDVLSRQTHTFKDWVKLLGEDKFVQPASPKEIFRRAVDKVKEKNREESGFQTLQSMERATRSAAIIGKGISQGGQPMVPEYWGEVVHDAHGYGRDLHTLMNVWKSAPTTDNFNTWMDKLTNGESVPGIENIPKNMFENGKLKISRVMFLNESERKVYQATINNRGLISTPNQNRPTTLVDINGMVPNPHIFVVSPDNQLYVGVYDRGKFNHSSFLAGGSVLSAGEMVLENGKIKTITDKSGHYQSSEQMILRGLDALIKSGADLSQTQVIMNSLSKDRLTYSALEFYQSKSLYYGLPVFNEAEIQQTLSHKPRGFEMLSRGNDGTLKYSYKNIRDEVVVETFEKTENSYIFKDKNGKTIDLKSFKPNPVKVLYDSLPKLSSEETLELLKDKPRGSTVLRQSKDGTSCALGFFNAHGQFKQTLFKQTEDPFIFKDTSGYAIDLRKHKPNPIQILYDSLNNGTLESAKNELNGQAPGAEVCLKGPNETLIHAYKNFYGVVVTDVYNKVGNEFKDNSGKSFDLGNYDASPAKIMYLSLPNLSSPETAARLATMPLGSVIYRQSSDNKSIVQAFIDARGQVHQYKLEPSKDPYVYRLPAAADSISIDIRTILPVQ